MVKLMVISWSVEGHVSRVDHGQIKVMLFWVDHGLTMVKLMVISWSVEGHVVLG